MIITSDLNKKCHSCTLLTISICPVEGSSISPEKHVTTVACPNRRPSDGQTALRAMGEIADSEQSLHFCLPGPASGELRKARIHPTKIERSRGSRSWASSSRRLHSHFSQSSGLVWLVFDFLLDSLLFLWSIPISS